MEKLKTAYLLEDIKELIKNDNWYPTGTAQQGAYQLGLSRYDIKRIVLKLMPKDFYKSMTSYDNPQLWQDVYYKEIEKNGEMLNLYIKLQIKQEGGSCAVVISFKKNDNQ